MPLVIKMPLWREKQKKIFCLLLTFPVTCHFLLLEEPAWEPTGQWAWEIGFVGFQPWMMQSGAQKGRNEAEWKRGKQLAINLHLRKDQSGKGEGWTFRWNTRPGWLLDCSLMKDSKTEDPVKPHGLRLSTSRHWEIRNPGCFKLLVLWQFVTKHWMTNTVRD